MPLQDEHSLTHAMKKSLGAVLLLSATSLAVYSVVHGYLGAGEVGLMISCELSPDALREVS